MGKKIIEVYIHQNKRILNCEDLKRIYYRHSKKNPVLPKYLETNDDPQPDSCSPTDTDPGLENCQNRIKLFIRH